MLPKRGRIVESDKFKTSKTIHKANNNNEKNRKDEEPLKENADDNLKEQLLKMPPMRKIKNFTDEELSEILDLLEEVEINPFCNVSTETAELDHPNQSNINNCEELDTSSDNSSSRAPSDITVHSSKETSFEEFKVDLVKRKRTRPRFCPVQNEPEGRISVARTCSETTLVRDVTVDRDDSNVAATVANMSNLTMTNAEKFIARSVNVQVNSTNSEPQGSPHSSSINSSMVKAKFD